MLILAIDTTSEWGGAGIFRDTECLGITPYQGATNYSVSLFQEVDRLLRQSRLPLRHIDLFAAANGPGAFTGIRVGLAAAQGWAHVFQRPARGVSVLEAMADSAQVETRFVLPILDARRSEFYAGVFQRASSVQADMKDPQAHDPAFRFERRSESVVLKPSGLASFMEAQVPQGETCTIIVGENDVAANALRHLVPQSVQWKTIPRFLVPSIARLAFLAEFEGKEALPRELSACYLRRSDAELNWEDR
jgi:tRNA threonylcarbamoyl adenosine modification protein YeaZ